MKLSEGLERSSCLPKEVVDKAVQPWIDRIRAEEEGTG